MNNSIPSEFCDTKNPCGLYFIMASWKAQIQQLTACATFLSRAIGLSMPSSASINSR